MGKPAAVYDIRNLVKRRGVAGKGFELCVPNLTIRTGEVVLLRGPSGCGKSTLLDMLAFALEPDAVEAYLFRPSKQDVNDIRQIWMRKEIDLLGRLRGLNIGYVLQTGGLLPFLTARENIELPCRLLGQPGEARLARLAQRLDIEQELDKKPSQLSVGERQRVAIARAMVHGPTLVLADEPTASVDPVNAQAILDLLLGLVRGFGVTAIIASHDWNPAPAPDIRIVNHRIERAGKLTRTLFWTQADT